MSTSHLGEGISKLVVDDRAAPLTIRASLGSFPAPSPRQCPPCHLGHEMVSGIENGPIMPSSTSYTLPHAPSHVLHSAGLGPTNATRISGSRSAFSAPRSFVPYQPIPPFAQNHFRKVRQAWTSSSVMETRTSISGAAPQCYRDDPQRHFRLASALETWEGSRRGGPLPAARWPISIPTGDED